MGKCREKRKTLVSAGQYERLRRICDRKGRGHGKGGARAIRVGLTNTSSEHRNPRLSSRGTGSRVYPQHQEWKQVEELVRAGLLELLPARTRPAGDDSLCCEPATSAGGDERGGERKSASGNMGEGQPQQEGFARGKEQGDRRPRMSRLRSWTALWTRRASCAAT